MTPKYTGVYAFDNDYPGAAAEDAPETAEPAPSGSLLVSEPEVGRCRVICFDPDHSLTLSQMPRESIARVIATLEGRDGDPGCDSSNQLCDRSLKIAAP